MTALVLAEHDNASIKGATLNAVTAASKAAGDVHVLIVGHNAAGAVMVLVLLALLLTQALSGLFADDLIFTRGPLARRVDEAWSTLATSVHLRAYWVILGCAVLHVLAVAAYRVVARRKLVKPMLTGAMEAPAGTPAPRMGSNLLALALLAASAGFVWWISTLKPASIF